MRLDRLLLGGSVSSPNILGACYTGGTGRCIQVHVPRRPLIGDFAQSPVHMSLVIHMLYAALLHHDDHFPRLVRTRISQPQYVPFGGVVKGSRSAYSLNN